MRLYISGAEQQPYDFKSVTSRTISFTLATGPMATADYGVCRPFDWSAPDDDNDIGWNAMVDRDPKACAIVERKSLQDFYGSVGGGRGRLEKEMQRMAPYGYAAVVIEANWSEILTPNDHLRHRTKVSIRSAVASVIAWSQRHGVHFHAMVNRQMSEQFTYRLLERWIRDAKP